MPAPTEATPHSNLEEAMRVVEARLRVALPATVVSYDHDSQRATIQLVTVFQRKVQGQIVKDGHPIIPGVPVGFMGSDGGGYSDTWPLEVGDVGVAHFCDRSIAEWLSTGAAKTDPQDPRTHDINDAVFYPGYRPFSGPVGALGLNASARVIRAPALQLGDSTATDYVALASLVSTELARIWTVLTTWGVVAGDGGAALKAAALAAVGGVSSVASARVRSL